MTRLVVAVEPPNEETPADALASSITPSDDYYVRSHFPPPTIDARSYRLQVDGAVARSSTLTIDEVRALGARSATVTMECAGDGRLSMAPLPSGEPFDEGVVSTATWTGTPLRALLDAVGLQRDVIQILAEGADAGTPQGAGETVHYARALPIEKALDPDTLLAWEMNGEPLPVEHGGPVRLVVPDWYGMASVKWLAHLGALDVPFEGWFQTNQYVYVLPDGTRTPVSTMRVKSHVVVPARGARVPRGLVRVSGWAWSGDGPIARVDVALDGGGPWTRANLDPQETSRAWTHFTVDLTVTARGRHTVRARATDASGKSQPEVAPWNALGYGNNVVSAVPFYVS